MYIGLLFVYIDLFCKSLFTYIGSVLLFCFMQVFSHMGGTCVLYCSIGPAHAYRSLFSIFFYHVYRSFLTYGWYLRILLQHRRVTLPPQRQDPWACCSVCCNCCSVLQCDAVCCSVQCVESNGATSTFVVVPGL